MAPGGGRRWSAFVGRVAVLLVLAACDDATGPAAPEEVVFAVEGEAFEIDPFEGVAVVPFTVRNPTAEAVYLNGCPPSPAPWADRREGGRWNRFSTYPCGAVTDVELAPGATVSGSYEIGEPGEYRLGLAVRAEAQGAESWLHITPPFEVR